MNEFLSITKRNAKKNCEDKFSISFNDFSIKGLITTKYYFFLLKLKLFYL